MNTAEDAENEDEDEEKEKEEEDYDEEEEEEVDSTSLTLLMPLRTTMFKMRLTTVKVMEMMVRKTTRPHSNSSMGSV